MVSERITVGVHALDQMIMSRPTVSKGWQARLAEAAPVLRAGAEPVALALIEGPDGLVLADAADLSGALHPAGTRVTVDRVAGRPGLFLIRCSGKATALASAQPWTGGSAYSSAGADLTEDLTGFVRGTLIDTPDGPRPAEDLAAGDAVTTLANGSRPLRWVGRRRVELIEMLAHPGLRPVVFAPGTIGNGRALSVSPQQRMLIDDWRAAVYFGEDRVLVAAQALVDDRTAQVMLPADGVDYVILLCDRHKVLLAEGALSESFHPGEAGLSGLSLSARTEITALVPEDELRRRRAAFPIVRNAEARALRLRS